MTNPLRRQVPSHVCINGFILWYVVTVHQCDDTARMFLCQGLLLQRNQHHRVGSGLGGPRSASVIAPVPASHICGLLPGWPPHPACFCWQNIPWHLWTYFPFAYLTIISSYFCFLRPLKLMDLLKVVQPEVSL